MNKTLLQRAEQVNNKRKRGKTLSGILKCLLVCCLVVSMVLPAAAQERQTICGQLAHEHFDGCFIQKSVTKRVVFFCTYDTLGIHVHDPSCYDEQGRVLCGQADYVVHVHQDTCYDFMQITYKDYLLDQLRNEVGSTKPFWIDEWNVGEAGYAQLHRESPWRGTQLGVCATAIMEFGIENSMLWTLYSQQWPNNTQSSGEFADGELQEK